MAPPTLPNASPLLNQRQRTIALVGTPPEAHVKGNPVMAEIVDWHQPQPRRRRLFIFMLAVVLALIFSSRTVLSYYVEALWFGSLGYEDAFRKTLALQWTVFLAFSAVTFLILYGSFLALWRVYARDLPTGSTIFIGGQPFRLPAERILGFMGLLASLVVALITGTSSMTEWPTFALYWYAPRTTDGVLVVSAALVLGAAIAYINVVSVPRLRWLLVAVAPAVVGYLAVQILAWYVSSFIVKPNELARERPYIAYNIAFTRQAYGLNQLLPREFPAETTVEAVDVANNQATLQNIRLWDWRALLDTLRQIQEIRSYYDFPDIDIDRYEINNTMREVMLATRELNVDKLPESSRNWINENLIYTHGYGITMNPVNGFTPEGLPTLILSNMPVQSTVHGLAVKRPEVYFGELTNTDVYVKTRQKEFNYPQGQTNSLTSYEGNGGIVLGSLLRRIIIAFDRGDLAKLPFSDDVNKDSQLLMRRNVRDRTSALAPFLTYDPDPYIVIGDDGRLSWIMDAFTLSDSYPYASHYRLDRDLINYMRNSVKVVIDAYDGTITFYVFDKEETIISAYRRIFPNLFKDAAMMPPGLRNHIRYPELLLKLQAEVYGLYHMTDPGAFY